MQQEQKYSVGHKTVQQLLSSLEGKELAMPEIQRPFVWNGSKVRDLIDSLYKGFPVGYIVISKSPNVRLKDGSLSIGQTMIIDGQQRITALATALLGWKVIDKDYSEKIIKIAFNPITMEFRVSDAATAKDKTFIPDISALFNNSQPLSVFVKEYCMSNPGIDTFECLNIIESVKAIANREIGLVELLRDLDMDSVTEIFNRINSQGVPLKEADFAMSKIAANESRQGNLLRKCIDHFCELVVRPEMYAKISENDHEFANSPYLNKVSWLKTENDDIYDPSYEDMLRVILTFKFQRGKMGDLVQLLSGRNFTTRTNEQGIIDDTYAKLTEGVNDFINETNFKNFVMVVSSAGFCRGKMIRSMGALNFAYSLYLYLRSVNYPSEKLQNYVRKWFVMSLLTGRYSGSAETRYEYDIKQIASRGIEDYLSEIERINLSEAFWTDKLVVDLRTSGTMNAAFNVFLAAQCKKGVRGFLSTDITVKDMIVNKGDIHHIFPRQYLVDKGLSRTLYNQVANYAYVQTEINIRIGKKSPDDYFSYVVNEQCESGITKYGGITNKDDLRLNMAENCIPDGLETMNVDDFNDFLEQRRMLMAEAIKSYYTSL